MFSILSHRGTEEAFLSRRGAEETEAQSLLTISSRHPDQGGSAAAEIPERHPDQGGSAAAEIPERHPDQGGSAAAEIPERYPDIPTSRNSGTLSPQPSDASLPACADAPWTRPYLPFPVGAFPRNARARMPEAVERTAACLAPESRGESGRVRRIGESRGESVRIELIDCV